MCVYIYIILEDLSSCRINPWDDCRTQDLGSNMESYQETHVFEHVDFWACRFLSKVEPRVCFRIGFWNGFQSPAFWIVLACVNAFCGSFIKCEKKQKLVETARPGNPIFTFLCALAANGWLRESRWLLFCAICPNLLWAAAGPTAEHFWNSNRKIDKHWQRKP